MKVAIVLMKGFDGCGVSRFAIEHQKYLRSRGDVCDIYAFADNTYVREKAHKDKDVIFYKNFREVDFSKYDIFVLNSYEKEFNEDDFEYYKSLPCIKVAMMHEITRSNVSRIKHVWDWVLSSDIVSSFSETMDFVNDLSQTGFNMNKYFSFRMSTNTDEMEQLFNDSLENERVPRLIYFGRWTSMKDPSRLYLYKKLDPSMSFSMIGIERSIGAFYDIFNNELCDDASKIGFLDSVEKFNDFDIDDSKVAVFPPIDRDVAMNILGHSTFGCSFYRLGKNKMNNIGNRMEFTQIEMSCVCLPVFDIDWGKNTFDVETGKSFYELGDNAIYSDKENLEASLNEMKALIEDKDEYNRRRSNLFELVKRNYGSDNIDLFYKTVNNLYNNKENTETKIFHKENLWQF